MTDIVVEIILAVIGILGIVATRYVVPYLKTKTSYNKTLEVTSIIFDVVSAAWAEGVKHGWTGEEQKQWAIKKANTAFGIDLTSEQYDVIRKAAVREMKEISEVAVA